MLIRFNDCFVKVDCVAKWNSAATTPNCIHSGIVVLQTAVLNLESRKTEIAGNQIIHQISVIVKQIFIIVSMCNKGYVTVFGL